MDNGSFEISLYNDNIPSVSEINTAINRLSIAFPKMMKDFFVLLTEFIIEHKFTAKRLSDSVNHVIANFQYKELNISDIIKFDKRKRLYTQDDVYRISGKFPSPDFELYKSDNKRFWIKISEN